MGLKTHGTRVSAESTDNPDRGGTSGVSKEMPKVKQTSSTPKGRGTGDTKNSP